MGSRGGGWGQLGARGPWLALSLLALLSPASASGSSYTNRTPILITANGAAAGPASPYPSTIGVSGLPGTVIQTRVTLTGLGHEDSTADVQAALVGPGGQVTMILSDACGGATSGLTVTFDDSAPGPLPSGSTCTNGTFRPTDYPDAYDGFAPPAPVGPYPVSLSVFNGGRANGPWQLFVSDDAGPDPDASSISGGWRLELLTAVSCSGVAATVAAHVGTAGNDKITGTPGRDVMLGLGGRDRIKGAGGNDLICGGPGKDLVIGGAGRDELLGQAGKDKLFGNSGRDVCRGGARADIAAACEKQKSVEGP